MAKQKYKPYDLWDAILTTNEIGACCKCGTFDNITGSGDENEVIEHFFREGWRSTKKPKSLLPKMLEKIS